MRRRSICIPFRLNEKEFADLDAKVKKSGLTRERFLRKMIAEKRVFEAPPVDFFTLLKAVMRVGSNIEQILNRGYSISAVDSATLHKIIDELYEVEQAMWKAFAPDGR